MNPGGLTDMIERFVGSLHIPETYIRVRFDHSGGAFAPRDQDWQPVPTRDPATERDADDLPSRSVANPSAPSGFSLIGVRLHKPGLIQPGHITPEPVHVHLDTPESLLPVLPFFASFEAAMPAGGPAPVPDQLLATVAELNVAQNDNLVLATGVDPTATLRDASAEANRFAVMILHAETAGPAGLVPGSVDSATLAGMIGAHDQAAASHSGAAPDAILQNGVYVDGILQSPGTVIDTSLPVLGAVATASQLALPPGSGGSTVPTGGSSSPGATTPGVDLSQANGAGSPGPNSHDGLTGPGLEARTGGNVSINAASITDDHTQHTGMVVMGDAYTTNAIVQTNILSAHAQVSLGGPAADRLISTAGNVTHDSASITHVDTTSDSSNLSHFSLGSGVQVDNVTGNFYDIKGLSQTNYLSNNDTVVQTTTSSYNLIDTGTNNQVNTLPMSELNGNYDLVIVQGSYHSANIIEQRNVLQSDSIVHEYTGRGDTALQSVTTGGNTLTNTALLDTYGNDHYQTLSPSIAAAIQDLEQGRIDPALAAQLPGSGASVHVLLISGDVYDINVISQTNILQNNDTVLQYLPHAGSAAAVGQPTISTEQVDTGGNHLANVAGIAQVGTTSSFQYVGGQAYSDAVLAQTNIVSDTAHSVTGQHHQLAAEMLAYAGLHGAEPATMPHTHAGLHDVHHSHDLFAGLMA